MVRRGRAGFLRRLRHNGGIRRLLAVFALFVPFVVLHDAQIAAAAVPRLQVQAVVSGLANPWDVAFTADGTMFFTERAGMLSVRLPNGTVRQLAASMSDFWASGETGLMGVEVDPSFASNRRIYTCQGTTDSNFTVQVIAWTVNAALTTATRASDPLVGGIDGQFGRHGGCQLRVDQAGALIIGTGDAALGTNPQNPHSLAGKTLRVDRFTGAGLSGNPYFGNPSAGDARVQTIGHRNLQGLALHTSGVIYSVEHGPDRDDEINRISNGANYGWDPVPNPYNESVPMTDKSKYPSAVDAAWSSGVPTLATSGATFLRGSSWGAWQGALAVSSLKGASLRLFSVNGNNATQIAVPTELNDTVGRIRAAEMGPDDLLYLTTDNNSNDKILVVRPLLDTGGVGVASSGPDRIDQVARAFDGSIHERHGTSALSTWTSLGGVGTSDPDLSSWGTGRLDAFVRGTDGAVWHKGAVNNVFVANWDTLGGLVTSGPSAVSWGANRIDVFARGTDGALWANAFTGGGWVGWYSLGGQIVGDPDAASFATNRLDVFARGTDGAMWRRTWTGTAWAPWNSLGGQFTSGAGAASRSANRLDVFGRGLDGALWSNAFNGTGWTGWFSLGGGLQSDPDAASRATGRLDVFVRGMDGLQWTRRFDGSSWLPWAPAS